MYVETEEEEVSDVAKIIKKTCKYLWMIIELVLSSFEVKNTEKKIIIKKKLTTRRSFLKNFTSFLDFFSKLFPILSVQNYPNSLSNKVY